MELLETLRLKHSIPGIVDFQPGNGGLIKAVITTPHAAGEVYLHGAHVTHYQPVNQPPVLFLSGSSRYEPGKAIRGGVPLCFPWFGALEGRDTAPAHGFARTSEWTLVSTASNPDGSATVQLQLARESTRDGFWPHAFQVLYTVTIGATLKLEFTVQHVRGEPFIFEEALHSYFHVGDVREVSVTGLGGTSYIDKMDGGKEKMEGVKPIRFVGETDRVYTETPSTCEIDDPKLNRKITIEKKNSGATVVWNPWVTKSAAMSDMGNDEWPGMLCIETCNVGGAVVTLAKGESHTMVAIIHSGPRNAV